jgi:hypothetical protein
MEEEVRAGKGEVALQGPWLVTGVFSDGKDHFVTAILTNLSLTENQREYAYES